MARSTKTAFKYSFGGTARSHSFMQRSNHELALAFLRLNSRNSPSRLPYRGERSFDNTEFTTCIPEATSVTQRWIHDTTYPVGHSRKLITHLLSNALEHILDGGGVADERGAHLQALRWNVAHATTAPMRQYGEIMHGTQAVEY